MTAVALAQRPTRLHAEPDHEVELCSREVTELLACASKHASSIAMTPDEIGEKMMRYLGETYKRDPLIANAAVNAYVFLGGNLCALIKAARKHRKDPSIGGYLSFLKAQLMTDRSDPETERRAWLLIRSATERACMWAGWTTEETRRELEHIDRGYRR
jgi:hypothetical protein